MVTPMLVDQVSYLGHEVHDKQLYIFLEYMPEGYVPLHVLAIGPGWQQRCDATS